ncbi:hypothetical protein BN59_01948 [Legionella massiliensis]|uniref:Interaptin n=1 Tax=Legionella massiliensis TaxID=1034943 RepID=A0A078L0T9_9GAMM|nr:hypothetical protein [Legionella massiliensis]CDZ77658.1 hypothetical protein BN59_01948 [Legionella massiliensis]CEE13396.1 hypothetical protein BN1094_01948 [Legionella massiliensis]
MADLNEVLAKILNDEKGALSTVKNRNAVIIALNAILEAGYGEEDSNQQFRQAVINHKKLFNPLIKVVSPRSAVKIADDADPTDDDFLTEEDGWGEGFKELTQAAAKQRVLLALQDATKDQLEEFIKQHAIGAKEARLALFNANGESIFGEPPVRIPSWNPNKGSIFKAGDLEEIQIEVQRRLLIKKIEEYNNPDAQVVMRSLLNCKNQTDFQVIVKKLFGPAPDTNITDTMQFKDILPRGPLLVINKNSVTDVAARKAVILGLDTLTDEEVLEDGLDILNADDDDFGDELKDLDVFSTGHLADLPLKFLADSDISAVKGILGTRFLLLNAKKLFADSIGEMEAVAIADTPDLAEVALDAIATTLEIEGDYTEHVAKASLPTIRQAFATQALSMKIALCDDVGTLDALIDITTVDELKNILATNSKLGYKDKPKFLEAFTASTDLNAVIAAAHISKNIAVTDKPENLRALIEFSNSETDAFQKKYHQLFSAPDITVQLKGAINGFLDKDNIHLVREQALLAYAKTELRTLEDDDLMDLINATTMDDVEDSTEVLFGSDIAKDLVGDPNERVSKAFRTYAAIEMVIRDAQQPNQDLSATTGTAGYDVLLAKINTFAFNDPQFQDLLGNPDFPAQEKARLQTILVESLIKNYTQDRLTPPDAAKLTTLAKETDLDKFKQLLTEKFDVTNVDWVTKESMEQIQKSACTRAIQLSANHPLHFGKGAHPELFDLIAQLPLEKQRALLDKPAALTALAAASTEAEIEEVLGENHKVAKGYIRAVAAENENLLNIAKVANSKIAEILANFQPPLEVTTDIVKDINNILLAQPAPTYLVAMQDITALFELDSDPESELFEQFGLEDDGSDVKTPNPPIVTAITEQQTRNQYLFAEYRKPATTPEDKEIILALAALSKNKVFPAIQIFEDDPNKGIVTDIKNCKTLASFLKLVNAPPPDGRGYKDVFDPPLGKQLTPQSFDYLKAQARLAAFLSPEHYEDALEAQKEETKLIKQQFQDKVLDDDARERLRRIAGLKPIYWFNPAFQAHAKQNAIAMGPELRVLAKQCDAYVTYLTNQLSEIEAHYYGLPSEQQIKQNPAASAAERRNMLIAVTQRANELRNLYRSISAELADYERLQRVFNGVPNADNTVHPLIRQGLIKTLDQAAAGKSDIRLLNFNTYSVPCDNSTKAAHMAASWGGEARLADDPEDRTSLSSDGSLDDFDIVPAIPEGKFREHTVLYQGSAPTPVKGLYIEERASKNLAAQIKPDGTVTYEPSIKLTVTKFPAQHQARMYFAMAMASQMLANLRGAPTQENPIRLRSNDPVQARYLWTALMILGESDKNMKFDHKQIKVTCAQFDPKSEFGIGGLRWGGDALYHKFKENPELSAMLKGVQEVNEKKFSKDTLQERAQARQDTTELTKALKQNMLLITEKNKEQEDTHGVTLGGPGGPK